MNPKHPALVLHKIAKTFRLENGRELEVLKDINLSVLEGEIVALLGPSGCGKTTTLRIMAGLMAPTEGQVLVNDQPLTGVNRSLSMVFQTPSLLPWYTVEQNVRLGVSSQGLSGKQLKTRVEESIDLVGLGGFEGAYPRELSGGLQQRVSIARALAVRPQVLCLDEPFSSLDALSKEDLRAEVVDIWREKSNFLKTIVFVTHDIQEAVFMAERIVIYAPNPGHIREVMDNSLSYPRDVKNHKFQDLVEGIHRVITEALIPEEEAAPSGLQQITAYQGLEHIPPVAPTEIVGLLELLNAAGGSMDIFELAVQTEVEFGHCLSITKTAEMLDFVDTPKQMVKFTPLGRQFVFVDDVQQKKEIFAGQIKRLRVFATLVKWIEEAEDKELIREDVISRLQGYFPNEKLEKLFDTLIDFGRYAEILSYNAQAQVLSLPRDEKKDSLPAETQANP